MIFKSIVACAGLVASLAIGTTATADTISFGDYFFPGDMLANGFSSLTDGHVPYTATGPGSGFTVLTEGSGWAGEFIRNTTLIYDNGASGPVTISFGSPINRITDLAAQANAFGPYMATLTAYDGAVLLGSDSYAGFNALGPEGTIPYFSFASPSITSITISVTNDGGGFAIGGTFGIPEPSSWIMLLLGFGVLGAAARGRRASIRLA